ncbi:MAG: SBBP repeat-containing protein, partial [Deltaproteobacteria bacterium]|nr:SBBP repeat-containing protein [Deltaproteobacteria bacterium]
MTDITQFSGVRYRALYPGIDLDFYGKQSRLEYDFAVYPGGDPGQIEFDFAGADELHVAASGDLVVGIDGRELQLAMPLVYELDGAAMHSVGSRFELRGPARAGFRVGNYDHRHTLIIDPVLIFSTYFGGSGAESCSAIVATGGVVPNCPAVAVDSASRVYLAGATTSATGFPTPGGGSAATIGPRGGSSDIFVARISSSGSSLSLDYLTFLGGSGTDYPTGIGVDSGFNVYLAGTTNSADFPVTSSAFQSAPGSSGNHVFLSKLNSTASANLYSTYLSGNGVDMASALAVDNQGSSYVFGTTSSANFPTTTSALQPTAAASNQFFFSKINAGSSGQNSLAYSTFLGGSTPANGLVTGGAIAVDSSLNVYLAGGTNFTNMPVLNAFQGATQGGFDAWVAKLNAPANNTQQYTVSFETYFGGNGDDIAYGVASDGTNTYVTGSTTSTNICVVMSGTNCAISGTTPFQAAIAGGSDAFLAKFGLPTTSGTTQGSVPVTYFTYLGGTQNDAALAIVADPNATGNVRITGYTDSADFPVVSNPVQGSSGGGRDAFIARILTTGTTTGASASSYLGGAGTDIGTSVAVDASLNTYVVGETSSANFPVVSALQPTLSGASDAFVSKLGPTIAGLGFLCSGTGCAPAPSNPTVGPTPVGVGNQITFSYTIYNAGDPVPGVLFTDNVGQPQNSTIVSATPSVGTCSIGSGSSTAFCNLGTVNTSTITTSGSNTSTAAAATVMVVVSATAPSVTGVIPPKPPDIGNSGVLTVAGSNFQQAASGTATVNDFGITASPATATVIAGATANYVVTATPTGPIPEAVTLACGSGLPSQASCSFSGNNSSIPNLNNGAQSRTVSITTTQRVTTPASRSHTTRFFYALWLPLSGMLLVAGHGRRRKYSLMGLLVPVVIASMMIDAGCGYTNHGTSTTTGTPAGTYSVSINA